MAAGILFHGTMLASVTTVSTGGMRSICVSIIVLKSMQRLHGMHAARVFAVKNSGQRHRQLGQTQQQGEHNSQSFLEYAVHVANILHTIDSHYNHFRLQQSRIIHSLAHG